VYQYHYPHKHEFDKDGQIINPEENKEDNNINIVGKDIVIRSVASKDDFGSSDTAMTMTSLTV